MTDILEKIERVFKVQDVKAKVEVGNIIKVAYDNSNGFSLAGGYIGKHLKLTIDTDGKGDYRLANGSGTFFMSPTRLEKLGSLLEVSLSEMTGVEIDISVDAEGQIIVEGEIKREFAHAVAFGVGGSIIFNPVEATKIIPGVANAMKVMNPKYQKAQEAWYEHCAIDNVGDEYKCRAQFGRK
jgi:hypothetical protein